MILGDLGSAILTVRAVLDGDGDRARLADAPLVEGAVSAAVAASAGMDLEFVVQAAEEARGIPQALRPGSSFPPASTSTPARPPSSCARRCSSARAS